MIDYDAEAFISEKISSKLKEGEKIMWCGCTADGATLKERGRSAGELVIIAVWFAAVTFAFKDCITADFISSLTANTEAVSDKTMLIFIVIFFSLFYLAGLSMVYNFFISKNMYYAVTNRRLYVLKKSGRIVRASYLKQFSSAYYKAGDRGIGVIKLVRKHSYRRGKILSIGGVADCAAVCDVFNTAIAAASQF